MRENCIFVPRKLCPHMQTPLTTRDSYHDPAISMLKGLAIILVVMGHSEWPMWILKPIYMVHMPIFFFVSGYLLKERHFTGSLTFIKRRLGGFGSPLCCGRLCSPPCTMCCAGAISILPAPFTPCAKHSSVCLASP